MKNSLKHISEENESETFILDLFKDISEKYSNFLDLFRGKDEKFWNEISAKAGFNVQANLTEFENDFGTFFKERSKNNSKFSFKLQDYEDNSQNLKKEIYDSLDTLTRFNTIFYAIDIAEKCLNNPEFEENLKSFENPKNIQKTLLILAKNFSVKVFSSVEDSLNSVKEEIKELEVEIQKIEENSDNQEVEDRNQEKKSELEKAKKEKLKQLLAKSKEIIEDLKKLKPEDLKGVNVNVNPRDQWGDILGLVLKIFKENENASLKNLKSESSGINMFGAIQDGVTSPSGSREEVMEVLNALTEEIERADSEDEKLNSEEKSDGDKVSETDKKEKKAETNISGENNSDKKEERGIGDKSEVEPENSEVTVPEFHIPKNILDDVFLENKVDDTEKPQGELENNNDEGKIETQDFQKFTESYRWLLEKKTCTLKISNEDFKKLGDEFISELSKRLLDFSMQKGENNKIFNKFFTKVSQIVAKDVLIDNDKKEVLKLAAKFLAYAKQQEKDESYFEIFQEKSGVEKSFK